MHKDVLSITFYVVRQNWHDEDSLSFFNRPKSSNTKFYQKRLTFIRINGTTLEEPVERMRYLDYMTRKGAKIYVNDDAGNKSTERAKYTGHTSSKT